MPRAPISAKLVADLITTAGASRVLTVDLHAGQIQGFFNIPVDHLFAAPVLLDYLRNLDNDIVVVSRMQEVWRGPAPLAKRLNASLAIIDKRRDAPNVSQVMNIIGDVHGRMAILLDDIVDTGERWYGQLMPWSKREQRVFCLLYSPGLVRQRDTDPFRFSIAELVVTDTIPLKENAKGCAKIKVLSISGLLTEAIQRIYKDESVSNLFV